MPKYASLQERLLHNSVRIKDCCVWSGYCQNSYIENPGTPGAYGRINLHKDGRSLKFPVHRVAKVLEECILLVPRFNFYNPVHKQFFFDLYTAYSACKLSIDHLCKVSLCINPTHLEWVHLSKNQQRKKWSNSKRKTRIVKQQNGRTRHYKALHISSNVIAWIKRIQAESHRIK
jgi:hypothetical protein